MSDFPQQQIRGSESTGQTMLGLVHWAEASSDKEMNLFLFRGVLPIACLPQAALISHLLRVMNSLSLSLHFHPFSFIIIESGPRRLRMRG